MAYFSGVIRSDVLGMDTNLHVILPYDRPSETQKSPCKTLYLLHGLGDNSAAWTRYTRIESYAREKGLAVVMPEVQRSFYYDMAHGLRYFTYVTQELPSICGRLFRLNTKREDSFIAGLSMGGYGALKCGLTYPEKYAACASFSGAVDIIRVAEEHGNPALENEFRAVLGMDSAVRDADNLYFLADRVAALPSGQQPALFITCGEDDFLLAGNRSLRQHLRDIGLDHTYREWPGEHTWPFWDESVRQALELWDSMALL